MKLLNLIKCNLKRMLKNKTAFILSFVLPALAVGAMTFLNNKTGIDKSTYYFVNKDKGVYAKELIKEIEKNSNVKLLSQDEAMERLKKKTITSFYIIDEQFSNKIQAGEKPQIEVSRREKSTSFNDFHLELDNYINKLMFIAIVDEESGERLALSSLQDENTEIKVTTTKSAGMGTQMFISLLVSFNLFCSIGMAYELAALKKERTLKRSLTTGSKPRTIIGAILGGQFIVTAFGYIILLYVYVFLNKNSILPQAPIIAINLLMTTALSLSLAVFISRIIKDDKLIGIVIQIVLCGSCFIGGSFLPYELLPKGIKYLSKFMPQYWTLQSIGEGKIEYSLIVLLFAIVLFTAGTISTRSFVD